MPAAARLPSLLAALSFIVAACATVAPTPPPTPSPEPATPTPAAVAPTPSPSPTPTPVPETPTAEPATPTPDAATPSPAPAMALEGRIEIHQQGYALTLPDGWLRVELTDEFLELLAAEVGSEEDFELFVQLMRGQLEGLEGMGAAVLAFNLETLMSGFATNVNVITAPSFGLSLDVLETLNRTQLEQMDEVDEVHAERVQLPAGEALHLSYVFQTPDADGMPVGAVIHQYLLIANRQQYVLTVSGLAEDASLDTDAQAMAESFELLTD